MKIQPIVEGHGEVSAVPVLLRRLRDEGQAFTLDIGRPIRRRRNELVNSDEVARVVRVALLQPGCAGILIVFDADDDCPKELGPRVQAWAQAAAGAVPCAVVIANREYEAWFLSTLEPPHEAPESVRGAKEELRRRLPGRDYSETVDQASMTALLDLAGAHQRCRSFRRMVRAFEILARAMGIDLVDWPPAHWQPQGQ